MTGLDAPAIGDLAAEHGIAVHALIPRSASLEEAYLDLTGESTDFRASQATPMTAPPVPLAVRARDVLTSEWTKLRSVRSTYWTLLVAVVTPIGISALVAVALANAASTAPPVDPLLPGLISQEYAVLAVGVLGVLAFSTEYSTGLIRTTFAAVPRRRAVLAAKAAVIGALTLVAGEVVAFASFALVQAVLSGQAPRRVAVPPRRPGRGAGRRPAAVRGGHHGRGPGRDRPAHRGRHRRPGRPDLPARHPRRAARPVGRPRSAGSPCSTPPARSPRCTRPRTCSRPPCPCWSCWPGPPSPCWPPPS